MLYNYAFIKKIKLRSVGFIYYILYISKKSVTKLNIFFNIYTDDILNFNVVTGIANILIAAQRQKAN